ncbi:MAG: sigma-54-dependent Fis family transcriptional regulator [Planctomycetes bacterium]|nr:sigma-54-dependent Fis family transcriptional regulator [Planctomycetota bacterium]
MPRKNPDAPSRVAVVEDEVNMRGLLARILADEGYEVSSFETAEDFLRDFSPGKFAVIVQDVRMPGMDGIEMLRSVVEKDKDVHAVVVTAYSTGETAVEAMRLGAFSYVRKPFDSEEIRRVVRMAVDRFQDQGRKGKGSFAMRHIVHDSDPMREVVDLVERVASSDATVLIVGESGTGKELVARAIHYHSPRVNAPFIPVNCGAFAESLLESELFGHVKGAFTGAEGDKKGLFEIAEGGTLFLDEISEMPMSSQVRLLRVLEERAVRPVGGTGLHPVDIRIIAATNKNIEEETREGRFRQDLFHRINVVAIQIPPLRERPGDIPVLAGHFLSVYSHRTGSGVKSIDEAALRLLMRHDWPGNVRELENAIERAVALCRSDTISVDDLPKSLVRRASKAVSTTVSLLPLEGVNLDDKLADVEASYIRRALEMTGGHATKAAEILGLSFRSLRYRMDKLGISRSDTQESEEPLDE